MPAGAALEVDPYVEVTKEEFFSLTQDELRKEVERAIGKNQYQRNPLGYWLDSTQNVLDFAGMIPVIGDTVDLINGLVYLLRGKPLEAGASLAAMIPIVGSLSPIGKKIVQLTNEIDQIADNVRVLREFCDVAEQAGKNVEHIAGVRSQLARLDEGLQALRQARSNIDNLVAKYGKHVSSYDDLAEAVKGSDLQRNHLNQNAVYGSVIPRGEGVAVLMQGDVIKTTGIGTPHRKFHESLEAFWDEFREDGARYLDKPTNGEYGAALESALIKAGHSAEEAAYLALEAKLQRAAHGLTESAKIPSGIPRRIFPKATGE